MLTIRWVNYFGDYDDYNEINIIGPYETAGERNQDLWRLQRLPGNNGDATFEASNLDPGGADNQTKPATVENATTFREFVDAFFGLTSFDDDGDGDVHPDQASIYTALAEQAGR